MRGKEGECVDVEGGWVGVVNNPKLPALGS